MPEINIEPLRKSEQKKEDISKFVFNRLFLTWIVKELQCLLIGKKPKVLQQFRCLGNHSDSQILGPVELVPVSLFTKIFNN